MAATVYEREICGECGDQAKLSVYYAWLPR